MLTADVCPTEHAHLWEVRNGSEADVRGPVDGRLEQRRNKSLAPNGPASVWGADGLGPPENLSHLIRDGLALRLTCECGHAAPLDPFALRSRIWMRRKSDVLADLQESLRCSACGGKSFRYELVPANTDLSNVSPNNPSMDLVVKLAELFRVRVADLVGENPDADDQPAEMVAMFRDLKSLNEDDRETIKLMMESLKKRREQAG